MVTDTLATYILADAHILPVRKICFRKKRKRKERKKVLISNHFGYFYDSKAKRSLNNSSQFHIKAGSVYLVQLTTNPILLESIKLIPQNAPGVKTKMDSIVLPHSISVARLRAPAAGRTSGRTSFALQLPCLLLSRPGCRVFSVLATSSDRVSALRRSSAVFASGTLTANSAAVCHLSYPPHNHIHVYCELV